MNSVLTISKREITRLRSRFTGKSRVALLAIILLAAVLGYVIYEQDVGLGKRLYVIGVSPSAPVISDDRFQVEPVDLETGYEMVSRKKLDVYIDGKTVYSRDDDRSQYAVGAIKQYLSKQEILRIAEEYEIDKAFPLRIEVRHMAVDDDVQGDASAASLAELLEPEPTPAIPDSVPEPDLEPEPTSVPEIPSPAPVPSPDSTFPDEIASATDDSVLEQLEAFRSDDGIPEFQAEFVADKEIIVPSLSNPPIPLSQVVLAFLYIIPLFLVGVFFTSSFMEEKLDRKLIVLLSAPVTPLQVIVGKMLPYLIYSAIAIIAITVVLKGSVLLSMAIFIPVSFFIFSSLLMVALTYRTFKDQTFFSVMAAWVIIAYLVTPAMFTGVSDVSYFSPLTLAVQMYRGESFGTMEYLLATLPLWLIFLITMFVGTRIFNEEYLMGFRPLYRKMGEAVYMVMDKSHLSMSVFGMSLLFIPVVLMVQAASIVGALNLGEHVGLGVILVLSVLSEEIAKSSGIAVLMQNRIIGTPKSIIKYSFLAALGFLIGEKALLYLTLSVVDKTMFVEAALGSGFLVVPLLLHFVTTSVVALLLYRLGLKYYPVAIAAGAIIHGAYNLTVMSGDIF